MKLTSIQNRIACLSQSLLFFKQHWGLVLFLGLVAALGRVMQLGGFGAITSAMHIALEVLIEATRILLFLYVLGISNVGKGLMHIKHFFSRKASRHKVWQASIQNLKQHWMLLLANLAGFACIAWSLNYLIDLLAYETCLYLNLKRKGILSAASSEWTILLFFKNLSVIPFTLVFETMLVLWLAGKQFTKNQPAV